MSRRLPVVVILLGVVLGAFVVDGVDDDPVVEATTRVVDASVFPIAADPSALSSTWFCAGGTADEEAFAEHLVVIANPTDADVTITLTAFGGVVLPPLTRVDGEDLDEPATEDTSTEDTSTTAPPPDFGAPVERRIDIPARSRKRLTMNDTLVAPIVSAMVEAPSGGIVVEHEVVSVHGRDAKPCVTSAAPTWHFAWGNTTVDARELLVLFNPFPDDAIVDGVFSTEDGVRQPERFDGLVIPSRGTVAVDLGDDVTRRQEVAATITARNGRIVVDRILRIDSDSDRGLTVQSGVPEPQGTWIYPDGFTSDTTREEYVVYNPGDAVAEVEIEFILDEPEVNGIPEPIDLSLAPGAHQRIDVGADGRVPPGVAHSGVVRSANGVAVVAERVLFSSGESRRGISVTTGAPVEAEQWNFAAGGTTDISDEWLVLVNLDTQIIASVDVTAVVGGQAVPVSELQGLELGAGQRRAIRLGERITQPDLTIVVTSSEPIVVERGLYRVGANRRGLSNAVGIPSPGGVRAPGDPLAVEIDADLGELPDAGDGSDDSDVPVAPDDVDLPSPDETIVIDDPDAEADDPGGQDPGGQDPGGGSTSEAPATTGPPEATTTTVGGVPDTTPG